MEIDYTAHSFKIDNGETLHYYDISNSISHHGAVAGLVKNELKFDLLSQDEQFTYIDVGANCGIFGLYIAKKFKNSNVLLFECNPLMIKAINLSIIANHLTNVQLYPFGLSNQNITEKIFFNFNNPGGCGIYKTDDDKIDFNGLFYDFETILNVHDNIKYLKIDIEGAEFNIFNKLIESNSKFFQKVSILNLEFHNNIYPNLEDIVTRKRIKDYLSSFSNLKCIYQS
jgi:FkbM family methyltransferase